MSVVPERMRAAFRRAGWFESRRVAVDELVPPRHPANAVLAELGGLTLVNPAPNRRTVEFKYVFESSCLIIAWETALNAKMVGIAEEDGGHGELYMTERGHIISCSLVHPACSLVGRTFGEAIAAIGRGERCKPMLLPNEEEVTLYGVVYRHGDDALLGPSSAELL